MTTNESTKRTGRPRRQRDMISYAVEGEISGGGGDGGSSAGSRSDGGAGGGDGPPGSGL